jgi:hypothetical protein
MNFYVHVCGMAVEFLNDFVARLFILCQTVSHGNHVCMSLLVQAVISAL